MFGSGSGAYKFWRYELASGSSRMTVNGCSADLIFIKECAYKCQLKSIKMCIRHTAFRSARNFSKVFLSPGTESPDANTFSDSSSYTWSKRPSSVVNRPPRVPACNTRSMSGILSPHDSLCRLSMNATPLYKMVVISYL